MSPDHPHRTPPTRRLARALSVAAAAAVYVWLAFASGGSDRPATADDAEATVDDTARRHFACWG